MSEGMSKYVNMQKNWYEKAASLSKYDVNRKEDNVVGSYNEHNNWPDYDKYLLGFVDETWKEKLALDFACGPGRNIVKYSHLFKRLDGADIAQNNLDNAKSNLEFHNIKVPNLYLTTGSNLGDAPDNTYDLIFSTIAMQHICVHEVRFNILRDMHRALRKLGRISIQMGFGVSPGKAGYFENNYDAISTNSGYDTMVEDVDYLRNDLSQIGFVKFSYEIRPTGPGDSHPHWIFFSAHK
ncbi:class I SAM-dependent methyltransferase [Methylobacterium currus]|uniref:Class I SAM-dependent methyltransferase n=2 Tax=Methylobacterium currus TaxID=2051553 RepID=A0A2R4WSC1_9HYPH|nr:class I SAM-dependent methyltransferase [Methylobacterium currus]